MRSARSRNLRAARFADTVVLTVIGLSVLMLLLFALYGVGEVITEIAQAFSR
jgi:uncharacterized membrane protein (Fun14 family)